MWSPLTERVLVCEIASDSVAVACVHKGKKGMKTEITRRLSLPHTENETMRITYVVESLQKLLSHESLRSLGRIHETVVVLLPSWYTSSFVSLVAGTKIKKDVLTSAEKVFSEEFTKKITPDTTLSSTVFEREIVKNKVRGYSIPFSGSYDVGSEVEVYCAAAPSKLLEGVGHVIDVNFHSPSISFWSFGRAASHVMEKIAPQERNLVLVSLDGRTTGYSIKIDSVLAYEERLVVGPGSIIEQIQKVQGLSYESAESLLHLYLSRMGNDEVGVMMKKPLGAIDAWAEELFERVMSSQHEYLVSNAPIMVFGADKSFLRLLIHVFSSLCEKNGRLHQDIFSVSGRAARHVMSMDEQARDRTVSLWSLLS